MPQKYAGTIESYLPLLRNISDKFANEYYDSDELFSQGQLLLVERWPKLASLDLSHRTLRIHSLLKHYFSSIIRKEPQTVPISQANIVYHLDLTPSLSDLLDEVLPEKQAMIIRFRYFENLTYKEIGKRMNLTGERVRQIEARALRKLRVYFYNKRIHGVEDWYVST